MAAKQISTTDVPKQEYRNYCEKGRQFFNVMKFCLEDREWDAVLLNGLHAAISFNDALTVFIIGKRSTSKIHQDAVGLLGQAIPNAEGRKNSARLSEILNLKNEIEYESKRFSEVQARAFSQKVERFILWSEKQLPVR